MMGTLGWAVALAGFGAIIGSFVAALAIRWPQGRSVVGGRSACDACGHVLGAVDLIPVASALLLRGRCRHCSAPIDPRHMLIEMSALLVGAAAGLSAPVPEAVAGAVFGWLLVALAALDLIDFWLPDRLTGLLAATGLASGLAGLAPLVPERLAGGALGFAGLWLVGWLYLRVRGRVGLGGGDPKLLGAIGLWLGWRLLPAVLLLASLVGLGLLSWRRFTGRSVARDDALPFGAFLAIAAYLAWLAMIIARP